MTICKYIHKTVDTAHFSCDDCMRVFGLYFDAYEAFTERGHPVPSYTQIAAVMKKMPFADVEMDMPLEPEDYEKLIPAYFMVEAFNRCDHNISHFFSGEIRKNRYYETCY